MTYDNANEIIKEIFESPLSRNEIGLETSMKGSDFTLMVLVYYNANVIK